MSIVGCARRGYAPGGVTTVTVWWSSCGRHDNVMACVMWWWGFEV